MLHRQYLAFVLIWVVSVIVLMGITIAEEPKKDKTESKPKALQTVPDLDSEPQPKKLETKYAPNANYDAVFRSTHALVKTEHKVKHEVTNNHHENMLLYAWKDAGMPNGKTKPNKTASVEYTTYQDVSETNTVIQIGHTTKGDELKASCYLKCEPNPKKASNFPKEISLDKQELYACKFSNNDHAVKFTTSLDADAKAIGEDGAIRCSVQPFLNIEILAPTYDIIGVSAEEKRKRYELYLCIKPEDDVSVIERAVSNKYRLYFYDDETRLTAYIGTDSLKGYTIFKCNPPSHRDKSFSDPMLFKFQETSPRSLYYLKWKFRLKISPSIPYTEKANETRLTIGVHVRDPQAAKVHVSPPMTQLPKPESSDTSFDFDASGIVTTLHHDTKK
jgi:hypothetical protein